MSEQADQTPNEREQQDPWAPPAERTVPDPAAYSSEDETIGAGTPPPGNHDGATLLNATGEPSGVEPGPGPGPEVSLTKGTPTAPEPQGPLPEREEHGERGERDIWAPPADNGGPSSAHGSPQAPTATPWPYPAGPSPYATTGAPGPGAPGPGGAVPPPPIGPEGPGPGYGYPGYPGHPGYGAQPGGAPYGSQPGYGWSHMPLPPSNGMGTAALVLGIISVVIFCLWPVAIIAGLLAVIFGGIGRGKASRGEANNGGQALAGLICGIVGLALGLLMLLIVVADGNGYGGSYDFGDHLVLQAAASLTPAPR